MSTSLSALLETKRQKKHVFMLAAPEGGDHLVKHPHHRRYRIVTCLRKPHKTCELFEKKMCYATDKKRGKTSLVPATAVILDVSVCRRFP